MEKALDAEQVATSPLGDLGRGVEPVERRHNLISARRAPRQTLQPSLVLCIEAAMVVVEDNPRVPATVPSTWNGASSASTTGTPTRACAERGCVVLSTHRLSESRRGRGQASSRGDA